MGLSVDLLPPPLFALADDAGLIWCGDAAAAGKGPPPLPTAKSGLLDLLDLAPSGKELRGMGGGRGDCGGHLFFFIFNQPATHLTIFPPPPSPPFSHPRLL
jgi:hypothetical protein